jgi:hypothetical protein
VYDCSRVFLLKYHPYRRVTSTLNGKPERTQILEIITLGDWNRAYETEKEKEIAELFDSNRVPMFEYPKFFDTYFEKMPIGMKSVITLNCTRHAYLASGHLTCYLFQAITEQLF